MKYNPILFILGVAAATTASAQPLYTVSVESAAFTNLSASGPSAVSLDDTFSDTPAGATLNTAYTAYANPVGTLNGPAGLGVRSFVSLLGPGSYTQTVTASMFVDDIVISSAGSDPLESLTVFFDLSGTASGVFDGSSQLNNGYAFTLVAEATLNGETAVGALAIAEATGTPFTEFASQSFSTLDGDGRFEVTFTDVPVNTALEFELSFSVLAGVVSTGPFVSADGDFDSTLTFAQDGPAFASSDTDFQSVNSSDLGILNSTAIIPSPAGVSIFAVVLATAARRRR